MSLAQQFLNRQTHRAEVNPMDISTIVSIYPKEIDEVKCTLQPGRFIIPPGSRKAPSTLVLGPSSWWKETSDEEPLLEIPVSSVVIAKSVVVDYCNGIMGCNMGDRMPGLFFIPGKWTPTELLTKKVDALDSAKTKQNNWFKALVEQADILWARTNGNPLSISSDARLAARELNLEHVKEWTRDVQIMELTRCKACGHLKNPEYPVCSNCKSVSDPVMAEKLGLVFAK